MVEPLSDVIFSEGIATVDILLNKNDLPGFYGCTDEKITIPNPVFNESINDLNPCKETAKNAPEFSLKIKVRYTQSETHEISFLESNLAEVLGASV